MAKETMTLVGQVIGRLLSKLIRIDQNKDGRISQIEIFSAVQMLITESMLLFGSLDEIKEAFKDITAEDIKELTAGYAQQFDLDNDRLEVLIERWLFEATEVYDLISDTVRFTQSLKEKQGTE